ncbi:hypothetical protein U5B43_08750 [Campylobacter sp. 9BO]|uniref:phage baseplate protein n=1 Tax=Campylobacter sp. 9BO TaxID=3424759 RepID=UPI003D3341CF
MQLINRKIGTFTLDVTEQESNKSTLRITKNPIESGANVADHAVLEPKQLTIKGKIVAYEPPTYTNTDELIDLVMLNLPRIRTAHRLTQRALKLKSDVEHKLDTINEYSRVILGKIATQTIAPFLPSYANSKNDKSTPSNRISDLLNKLLELQRSGELLEVQTGVKLYKNMMITSIEATTQDDLSLDVNLNLEEIFIVQTKTSNGLKVATATGAKATSKNMGKTQPAKKSSFLKDMVYVSNPNNNRRITNAKF